MSDTFSPSADKAAPQPPWMVFPHINPPTLAFTQGTEEAWLEQIWLPFWLALKAQEREAYLNHWSAPQAWRDEIMFYTEMLESPHDP